ncbi:MAG: gamma-glutamylcyclotransferase family protein [Synergistaceae bacterium]|nr:gamma-glutamylcyclotransferase family protein [Synergistaceae bacterium]
MINNYEKNNWTYNFAYGSNMLSSRMKSDHPVDAVRCPNAEFIGIARLDDYRFIISDRNQKASVIKAPGEYVLGVLWRISKEEESTLDKREGAAKTPPAYHKKYMEVKCNGETINALVYVDRSDKINNAKKPTEEYIGYIIDGANEHGINETDPDYFNELLSWK